MNDEDLQGIFGSGGLDSLLPMVLGGLAISAGSVYAARRMGAPWLLALLGLGVGPLAVIGITRAEGAAAARKYAPIEAARQLQREEEQRLLSEKIRNMTREQRAAAIAQAAREQAQRQAEYQELLAAQMQGRSQIQPATRPLNDFELLDQLAGWGR